MKKILLFLSAFLLLFLGACKKNTPTGDNSGQEEETGTGEATTLGKTLVVWYSYTGNIKKNVEALCKQIEADAVEVVPSEKGLKYEANNYAIGSAQIQAIKDNPDKESSYPGIDTSLSELDRYDTVIIATPLWWSQMAAPMQTLLFKYGKQFSGKKTGLIVSSASSGISGVESDAKRLVPDGKFMTPSLWIKSSETSKSASMIEQWLKSMK